MIDAWLKALAEMISANMWLAPLLAILAGVLTSFTPCSLSSVPLIVGYVGGTGEKSTKKAFGYSAVFSLGTALTFVTLGVLASSAGRLMSSASSLWYLILGVLMVLMALQTYGLYNIIPSSYLVSKSTKRGFGGAFIAGILGGIFSSPCSTPVLIALLAIVAGKGQFMWGILLMLLYAIGHSTLVMIAGTSVGFVQKLSSSEAYGTANKIFNLIMGSLILLIGFYMFYLGF